MPWAEKGNAPEGRNFEMLTLIAMEWNVNETCMCTSSNGEVWTWAKTIFTHESLSSFFKKIKIIELMTLEETKLVNLTHHWVKKWFLINFSEKFL